MGCAFPDRPSGDAEGPESSPRVARSAASQPARAPASQPTAVQGLKPAQHGLGPEGALRMTAADRCPVCAMRPMQRPKAAAGLSLSDGRTFYTCGNGCLLRAHRSPERYLGVGAEDIERLVVRDYFTGRSLDAHEAFWVLGSDVVGPMGPAIVPLSSTVAAERFRERHGGQPALRLNELQHELSSGHP